MASRDRRPDPQLVDEAVDTYKFRNEQEARGSGNAKRHSTPSRDDGVERQRSATPLSPCDRFLAFADDRLKSR